MAATDTITAQDTATPSDLWGALAIAQNRTATWKRAAEDNQRELTAAQDELRDLRRRVSGALHRVRTFDCASGAGFTAGLLTDPKLLLESSRDGEVWT